LLLVEGKSKKSVKRSGGWYLSEPRESSRDEAEHSGLSARTTFGKGSGGGSKSGSWYSDGAGTAGALLGDGLGRGVMYVCPSRSSFTSASYSWYWYSGGGGGLARPARLKHE